MDLDSLLSPSRAFSALALEEKRAALRTLGACVALPVIAVACVPEAARGLVSLAISAAAVLVPLFLLARLLFNWIQGEPGLLAQIVGALRPEGVELSGDAALGRSFPIVTSGLIVANLASFHAFDQMALALPIAHPESWAWTNFSAMFAHGDLDHLSGNLLFLWVFGAPLEARVGRLRMALWYLGAGTVANLLTALTAPLDATPPDLLLGASGAISGLMGIFLIRCSFLRVFGATSYLPLGPLPLSIGLRLPGAVIATIFFLADLIGARDQMIVPLSTAYWAHIGGYLTGIYLAFVAGLFSDGYRESLSLRAAQRSNEEPRGVSFAARQELLRLDPDNVGALLATARDHHRYGRHGDAQEAYGRIVRTHLDTDPTTAALAFAESFAVRPVALPLGQQISLTPWLVREGQIDIAARALEMARSVQDVEPAAAARAALIEARLLADLNLDDAAERVYELIVGRYAETPSASLAQERLRKMRG